MLPFRLISHRNFWFLSACILLNSCLAVFVFWLSTVEPLGPFFFFTWSSLWFKKCDERVTYLDFAVQPEWFWIVSLVIFLLSTLFICSVAFPLHPCPGRLLRVSCTLYFLIVLSAVVRGTWHCLKMVLWLLSMIYNLSELLRQHLPLFLSAPCSDCST